jgi:hypothetical protein
MKHIDDADLVRHLYGEGSVRQRASVERHLAACTLCADAAAELRADLGAIADTLPTLANDGQTDGQAGERIWQAIRPMIHAANAPRRRWFSLSPIRAVSFATAGLIIAAVAFYAGHEVGQRKTAGLVTLPPAPAPTVVLVVVGNHLDRSERLLVALNHPEEGSGDAAEIQSEARALLSENRVCRQNAAATHDPTLAPVLDQLDRVLTDLSGNSGTTDLADIQRRMNTGDLLFEIRVLRNRMPDSAPSNPAPRGTI